jgi:hypothetical protein
MRKIAAISAGIAIGVVATMALSSITSSLLAANDPAYQCADRYLASGVFQIGDKPMPEGLAALIGRQCKAEITRQSIIRRYNAAHLVLGPLMGVVISLVDTLMLIALVIIPAIASSLLIYKTRAAA